MTRKEFDNKVKEAKKELLNGDAFYMYHELKIQHLHRRGGIEDCSFDSILTSIAKAKVLGVDLIEGINIDEWIKEL